jgi:hypothetical protein
MMTSLGVSATFERSSPNNAGSSRAQATGHITLTSNCFGRCRSEHQSTLTKTRGVARSWLFESFKAESNYYSEVTIAIVSRWSASYTSMPLRA